jgi:hypothetical protein
VPERLHNPLRDFGRAADEASCHIASIRDLEMIEVRLGEEGRRVFAYEIDLLTI